MTLLVGGLVALIVLGVPVALALLVTSVVYLFTTGSIPLQAVSQRMTAGVDSFPILAVPFFILAGNLMNTGGITRRIFDFANTLVGHWRGGLGHVNILGSVIFAGMSGAAIADAGGLGAVEIQAMREGGYDDEFSVGITAASSTIGPIIPPSIPAVVYGVIGGVSIGGLFVGGIVPGLLMAGVLAIMVDYYARRRHYPQRSRASLRELVRATRHAFLPLLTPVILLGGIITGVTTPTEAAIIAVAYALVLSTVVYHELDLAGLKRVLLNTVETTATVMLIVAAASLFGWILAREQVPQLLAQQMATISRSPFVTLLIVNLFLFLVGMFMETIAALTILIPVLQPVIMQAGIDPLHFGVVMILNLMVGLLTPPVGMVLYVLSNVTKMPVERIVRGTAPFIVPLAAVLLLITYVPQLVTWLPRLVFGQ